MPTAELIIGVKDPDAPPAPTMTEQELEDKLSEMTGGDPTMRIEFSITFTSEALDALSDIVDSPRTVDEMHHTGGAGISYIERWSLFGADELLPIWIWRVMWVPFKGRGRNRQVPVKIAYGAVEGGQPEAQKAGRKEAIRLAKIRRSS